MSQPFRLEAGGRIDRSQPLNFYFNGRAYQGYEGDTLASALLANGQHLLGRSFKYHRPRGLMTASDAEPNAILDLYVMPGEEDQREPNAKAPLVPLHEGLSAASVNCFPSPRFDLLAINSWLARFFPAGFYYKIMQNRWLWNHLYEPLIRRAAGLGVAPSQPDKARYENGWLHSEVLIVGAGPAGLSAALTASQNPDVRVLLVDYQPELGGTLLDEPSRINGQAAADWIASVKAELEARDNVTIMTRAFCVAYHDHNYLAIWHRLDEDRLTPDKPGAVRERYWRVRAGQVILACGAQERPLAFVNNDLPGVMLSSAAVTYAQRYAVKLGEAGVLVTNNDAGLRLALALLEAGLRLKAVIDVRVSSDSAYSQALQARGVELLVNHSLVRAKGRRRVSGIEVAAMREDGKAITATEKQEIACDFLAVSGGFSPAVQLHCQAGGKLDWDEEKACFCPRPLASAQVNPRRSVGAANGDFTLSEALAGGAEAARETLLALGYGAVSLPSLQTDAEPAAEETPLRPLWVLPSEKDWRQGGWIFIDPQNDVKASDIALANQEGFLSVEHTKRYTTLGMASDQGRTSNVLGLGLMSELQGKPIPEIGTTTFRAPTTPVTFAAIAGRETGQRLAVIRRTPMHPWHEEAGAVFEDVGQWKRPLYYPRGQEDKKSATARECQAVRDAVGIFDASTLGKIEVKGPDAATFLERVYTNRWQKLKPGSCRYGIMLRDDGMIFDDGVTARLADDHFLMTTTSGGAAAVFGHLEEYLQTEWPDLQVYLTSVTEQWATVSLAGPKARALLAELCEDELSAAAFPFMRFIDTKVAGIEARLFRISFTGDLSYEINVPADYGLQLWTVLMTAGRKYGITPYGTEAMHVLRAEKGFIIVGQDTDGSMTPSDMGMDGLVRLEKPDFIGKRALSRPDMALAERKQFVGLLSEDPEAVLPEGAQLISEANQKAGAKPPLAMEGHVSSSYWSPACGRSIALALVKGGRARYGERLFTQLADGQAMACTVTEPLFFDPEGLRQHA